MIMRLYALASTDMGCTSGKWVCVWQEKREGEGREGDYEVIMRFYALARAGKGFTSAKLVCVARKKGRRR